MTTKSRFSNSDVQAMIRDLRGSILGQRVVNIYDHSNKVYLIKFNTSMERNFLYIDCGVRVHTTKYTHAKNELPSAFVMKLRKYIRAKRLEDIRQLSGDRILDFKFGSGEVASHLLLEMYSHGNIILTDSQYEIIALLRSHQFEEDVAIKVGEIYPMDFTVQQMVEVDPSSSTLNVFTMSLDQFVAWALDKDADRLESAGGAVATGGDVTDVTPANNNNNNKKKVKKSNLRQLLLNKESGVSLLGGEIIDHCLLTAGVNPSLKSDQLQQQLTAAQWDKARDEFRHGSDILETLNKAGQPGYILCKPLPKGGKSDNPASSETKPEYVEFVPLLLKQHENVPHLAFPSFDEAVDEYFCKIDNQKLQQQAVAAESAMLKKVEKVKNEQQHLLDGLTLQQQKMERIGLLLEAHAEDVNKVMIVLNSALSAGMSWNDIDTMVKRETANGNPIAALVHKLKLERNHVVLRLKNLFVADELDESERGDDEDEFDFRGFDNTAVAPAPAPVIQTTTAPTAATQKNNNNKKKARQDNLFVEAEIDLALSVYANIRTMFVHKKTAQAKELKTMESSQRVIESVQNQAMKNLNAQKIVSHLRAIRKIHWFEKFNWFISSEGCLVLSGRDAQQNEMLVKKYLRPQDIYVHANLSGAATCIVRNKSTSPTAPLISPITLQEAATMAVCRSVAWTNKVVASAWWVFASQVSKTAPSGEYLSTGSFMIIGKKNFLPPSVLEMGFAVMFRLEDSCVQQHQQQRKDRINHNDLDKESMYSEAMFDRYGIEAVSENDATTTGLETVLEHEVIAPTMLTKKQVNAGKAKGKNKDTNNKDNKDNKSNNATAVVPVVGSIVTAELDTTKETQKPPASAIKTSNNNNNDDDENEVEEEDNDDDDVDDVEEGATTTKPGKKATTAAATTSTATTSKLVEAVKHNKSKDKKPAATPTTTAATATATTSQVAESAAKKKVVNKKKLRRYAEQDEEDRALALKALGHTLPGELTQQQQQQLDTKKEKDKQVKKKQEKVGVLQQQQQAQTQYQTTDEMLSLFGESVQQQLLQMMSSNVLKEGEIDGYELKSLASFDEKDALAILLLLQEALLLKKVNNKSGLLAGIMKRFQREAQTKAANEEAATATTTAATTDSSLEKVNDSLNQLTLKKEAVAKKDDDNNNNEDKYNDEDGEGEEEEQEEEEGEVDELDKITGCPTSSDLLLYAIPVCGPYSTLHRYKYRVKLTPGVGKKGKVCKQAIEAFTINRSGSSSSSGFVGGPINNNNNNNNNAVEDVSATERNLMKGLTDPEMVAIMIGDVKMSMPGLQVAKQQAKKQQRGEKKKHFDAKA